MENANLLRESAAGNSKRIVATNITVHSPQRPYAQQSSESKGRLACAPYTKQLFSNRDYGSAALRHVHYIGPLIQPTLSNQVGALPHAPAPLPPMYC
jgi:hypothetical protein